MFCILEATLIKRVIKDTQVSETAHYVYNHIVMCDPLWKGHWCIDLCFWVITNLILIQNILQTSISAITNITNLLPKDVLLKQLKFLKFKDIMKLNGYIITLLIQPMNEQ